MAKIENKTVKIKDLTNVFDNIDNVDLETVVYTVENFINEEESNQFNYGITTIYSGDVNGEYFMTKGHLHNKPECAEVYYRLEGEGIILMGDEKMPLKQGEFCYINPYKIHRAINTGKTCFKFLTVFRSDSGHNYDVVFNKKVFK